MRRFVFKFVLSLMIFLSFGSVSAYEKPENIKLRIETKEIDIKDIPENRVVSVGLYTENTPPYMALSFVIQKDSRLNFFAHNWMSESGYVENQGSLGVEYDLKSEPNLVIYNVIAYANKYIDYDGLLVYLNFILPTDVRPGDYFSIEFISDASAGPGYENSILLENDWDADFGNDSFSELVSGGIRIIGEGYDDNLDDESSDDNKENIDKPADDKVEKPDDNNVDNPSDDNVEKPDDNNVDNPSDDNVEKPSDNNKEDIDESSGDSVLDNNSVKNPNTGVYDVKYILMFCGMISCVLLFNLKAFKK